MCWILKVKGLSFEHTRLQGYNITRRNLSRKYVTYIKCTIQNWSRVLVLHSHGVASHVIETDSAVPRGNQEKLGCAGAELDSRDAILWSLIELVLV